MSFSKDRVILNLWRTDKNVCFHQYYYFPSRLHITPPPLFYSPRRCYSLLYLLPLTTNSIYSLSSPANLLLIFILHLLLFSTLLVVFIPLFIFRLLLLLQYNLFLLLLLILILNLLHLSILLFLLLSSASTSYYYFNIISLSSYFYPPSHPHTKPPSLVRPPRRCYFSLQLPPLTTTSIYSLFSSYFYLLLVFILHFLLLLLLLYSHSQFPSTV
ncbi:unnamed protein product [Acanthosepion pharaonis]|uniref:Uncharacterized protein n=1 Tax=Acanthosepion pharaonis TaxID=158019 RepID=A0A812CI73_ACAPH|nr:unnamed protein product [Sepia pharaonis]